MRPNGIGWLHEIALNFIPFWKARGILFWTEHSLSLSLLLFYETWEKEKKRERKDEASDGKGSLENQPNPPLFTSYISLKNFPFQPLYIQSKIPSNQSPDFCIKQLVIKYINFFYFYSFRIFFYIKILSRPWTISQLHHRLNIIIIIHHVFYFESSFFFSFFTV